MEFLDLSKRRTRNSSIPLAQYPENTESESSREVDAFLGQRVAQIASDARETKPGRGDKVLDEHGQPAAPLFRSWFVLILVLSYAIPAVLAWVITCILSFRPISGPKQYGVIYDPDSSYYGGYAEVGNSYVRSEEWFRAARVIQSIVSVLTIPLTSAVCSSAAVIFVQHHRSTPRLTIRQLITLADRGWVGPGTFGRLAISWRRYGSSFLLLAIFLTILGGILSPLQQLFLSSKTIKTPTFFQSVNSLFDIADPFLSYYQDREDLVTTVTRNALMSATNGEPQSQLWQGSGTSCNMTEIAALVRADSFTLPANCGNGNTLGNISSLADPFLAQLPNGYSTGLIRQYIPRFNSTARYENISATEYPSGCSQIPGAFYVQYTYVTQPNTTDVAGWNVEACMPTDMSKSPWMETRDRQDFTETLYLNISIYGGLTQSGTPVGGSMFRITLDTTGGYFELPNYMNGQVPGSLLTTIPNNMCGAGTDCLTEGSTTAPNGTIYEIFGPYDPNDPTTGNTKRDSSTIYNTKESNSSASAEMVVNKGPLLTTALALFGSGSFLADRIAHPEAYIGINYTRASDTGIYDPANVGACIDLFPMGLLFAELDTSNGGASSCISNTDYGSNGDDRLGTVMASWINNFLGDTGRLSSIFTAAGFLANQAWMSSNGISSGSLIIHFDFGADTQVPTISHAGIIIISTLLALYLVSLFIIALYTSLSPRWTNQLDAFAMMQIGAAMSDKISLMVMTRQSHTNILDEAPGWIGDVADEHEKVGRLGLGARRRLDPKRLYGCDTWVD
ncbi:uncharacterized protein LY89DRAFT_788365 [Mollisia scopiformis]|uniref:Uncharacterized protein n=1 Tax=Mollisia scopiformis TaxID=149040 RepID=A0A132BAA6_MOLSC|nr:uncharacterized protein LY89DRAFT_788365 [Mollisia scopiformis]KUJ08929.1 hypothetical protein LY89DRAFT_788365 [Mollisia scopiformis]